jgi:hypothetical protein
MSEHGLPGALAPNATLIDVLGLHDKYFAKHGFSAAALFRRRPYFIWMPHPDHTRMLSDITAAPELWRDYDVYPDAFFYGIAIRRGESGCERVHEALAEQWQKTYSGYPMDRFRAIH